MELVRSGSWLIAGVMALSATQVAWGAPCETIGAGDKVVCSVLGQPCSPPENGNCHTIIFPKGVTKCSRCDCLVGNPQFPDDSTFALNTTGVLPATYGWATVRWVDGQRMAAFSLRGLTPFASFQVYARTGTSSCSGGSLVALGSSVTADASGDAAVLEPTPGAGPFTVREASGSFREVLCGTAGAAFPAPAGSPWGFGALALSLAGTCMVLLTRRFARSVASRPLT